MKERKKKICFEGYEKEFADLRIRLRYDNLSQKEFFTIFMQAYLKNEKKIISFIREHKILNRKMGVKRSNQAYEEILEGKRLKKLQITELEKEEIFDLIEGAHRNDYEE